jgi:choline dehydrogenase-like flavoprotein
MSFGGVFASRKLQVILDLEKNMAIETDGYDVCVIGAGAAGIVLALDLAQRGARTLLLEAGGKGYEARSQDLYLGEISGIPYKGLYDGRFRTLGGTTTQWGGQILEIDDFIFQNRSWVDGSGWPFPKSELQPFYDLASKWERLDRSLKHSEDIWAELGLEKPDFHGDLVSALSQWCPATNFARIYGDALAQSKTLTAVLHANACGFFIANDGATVTGVRCRTLRGGQLSFRAKKFVLSMGAIENCRLLLHPSAAGSATPWGQRGLVGRFYQDHVSCIAADILDQAPETTRNYFDYVSTSGFRFQPKMKLSPANQEALRTLDVCGFMLFFSGEDDDMALAYETYRLLKTRRLHKLSAGRLMHFAAHLHELAWHKMPYSRSLKSNSKERTCKLCVNTEQIPFSAGRIDLSAQMDVLGLHRPRVAWKTSEQELHSIRRYVEVASEVFARKDWGRIVPHRDLFAEGDVMSARFEDIFHHIGGTRMGLTEGDGVVDPDLKIFGTRNAYVCSSSVFPCAGFANPTHTVIALALRLAHHLADLSKQQS